MVPCGILLGRASSLPRWWLPLAVTALLPVTSLTAGEAIVALRGSSAGGRQEAAQSNSDDEPSFDDGPQNPCSCDCCDVVRRLPNEVAFGTGIKCNPSTQHSSDTCPSQCTPGKDDKVLRDELVDLERFCFFECKPAAGPRSPDTTQCIAFSEAEAAQTIDPAGNPIDPAFLYSRASANLLQSKSSASTGSNLLLSKLSKVAHDAVQVPDASGDPSSPDSVDKKEAKKTALKGKAQSNSEGREARLEAARLREMERLKQKELHAALKESGNGVVSLDPFAKIQDLDTAAIKARVASEEAAVAASHAVQAYDAGRRKIWGLALSEAGKEVLRWQKYATEKAKNETEARFKPTWQSKALKKAQDASKPYIEGLLRAQESVKLYNEKGFAMSEAAMKKWNSAQLGAAEANKLPRDTIQQMNVAQSDMLDARNEAKEAQSMALEARQYFTTAAEVRKGIPVYQFNAQKAAAQAVAAMSAPSS